jgi:hypothetical protein
VCPSRSRRSWRAAIRRNSAYTTGRRVSRARRSPRLQSSSKPVTSGPGAIGSHEEVREQQDRGSGARSQARSPQPRTRSWPGFAISSNGVNPYEKPGAFSVIAGFLLLAGQASAQDYTFVSIDVHCSATTAAADCPEGLAPGQVATQTSARGINARGEIVCARVHRGAGGEVRDQLPTVQRSKESRSKKGTKSGQQACCSPSTPLARAASLGSLDRWTVGPLDRWTVGSLDRWTVGPLS